MNGAIQYDMLELGRAFKWGFISDGIVRTIEIYKSHSETPKGESQRENQLAMAYEFLEMVEKGEEQVDTGRLQSNAVDSIGAYRRSLSAFSRQPKDGDFKSYIESLKNGLDMMRKSQQVKPQQIESIEQFFRAISESTFEETERLLEKRKEIPKWIIGFEMP